MPEQLSPAERAKTLRAATTLRELRQQKDHVLVAELLTQAISATGYDAILLTEFLGHRKWANVQKLVEQARTLDRTRPGDLNGFVTQLSEFVVRTPKEPLAATRAEGDVIRFMTIHYAKGLEFPLVVVPDLERMNVRNPRRPVFDQHLGPLVPAEDKKEIVAWNLHQVAEKEQDREERKRLLYVACTRAADYLLLSSSVGDLHKPTSDWMKFLGEHFDLTDGRCLQELPAGYCPPEIRVTSSQPETSRKPIGPSRRNDLQKLIDKTHQVAESGQGVVPMEVAPIPADLQSRRRYSFSRLSGQLLAATSKDSVVNAGGVSHESNQTDSIQPIDPRSLGNLVHAVLERIDFAQQVSKTELTELCSFLAPQHVEFNLQATITEALQLIQSFQTSPRAAQLASAKRVEREIEFLMPWPAVKKADGSNSYLHGYIDCLYQDTEGHWHLLDYKSNQVTAERVPELAENYLLQMFVYGLACESALGVVPVESALHFLRPGEEFIFSCDDAMHAQLTSQLTQAILAN